MIKWETPTLVMLTAPSTVQGGVLTGKNEATLTCYVCTMAHTLNSCNKGIITIINRGYNFS